MDFFILGCACNYLLINIINIGWKKLLDDATIMALFTDEELKGREEAGLDDTVKLGRRKARVQSILDSVTLVEVRRSMSCFVYAVCR